MRKLSQNASSLQNATTLVTKCVSYHKIRRYYKMPQPFLQNPSLLQNATTLLTKCVSYYKIRRYYKVPQPLLQNA